MGKNPFVYLDRLETDVICVLQHRDEPRAVKTDIELARQAVERTVVEDVKMPFACVGTGVDQFLRVDTGGRRSGDVPDVVGAQTRASTIQRPRIASIIATEFFASISRI